MLLTGSYAFLEPDVSNMPCLVPLKLFIQVCSKTLKKLLKKIVAEDANEKLAVADAKLGNVIQDKLDLNCVADSKIGELMRFIRSQASGLIWD